MQLDCSSIDFGCVLADSTNCQALTLTNAGSVPVTYSWAWLKAEAGELQLPAINSTASD